MSDEPAVHLLRQLLRIQKIASRYPGHTSDWSILCADLNAIYAVAYNTIRDFPLVRAPPEDSAPTPRGALQSELLAALQLALAIAGEAADEWDRAP